MGSGWFARGRRCGLALVTVVGLLPATRAALGAEQAAAAPPAPAATEVSEPGAPSAPGEVAALRTASTRTSMTADGTFQVEAFPGSIHYRDGDRWLPISNRLVRAGSAWANEANRYDVALPAAVGGAGDRPVRVQQGADWATMRLVGSAQAAAAVAENVATYGDVLPGVDLVYEAGNDGVKESIVLAGPASPSTFEFRMTAAPGLAWSATPGGGIELRRGGDVAFALAAPYMVDADGTESAAVTMEHAPVPGGVAVTLTADRTWLADPDRAWPVVVDPTIWLGDASAEKAADCHMVSTTPTTNYCSSSVLDVGRNAATGSRRRAVVRFPTLLTELALDARVVEARLDVWVESATTTNWPTLEAYQVDREWTPSMTWNSYDGSSAWSTPGGALDLDYSGPSGSTSVTGTGAWARVYTTGAVDEWVEHITDHHGFFLKLASDTTVDQTLSLTSADAATSAHWPRLVVNFETNTGLRSFYRYESFPLTDRSSAHVNLGNGNLVVAADDLRIQATGLPMQLSRHYNSRWPWMWSNGEGWTMTGGPSIRLTEFVGVVKFTGPSNYKGYFDDLGGGVYEPGDDVQAELEKVSGQFHLTFNHSQEEYTFSLLAGRADVYVLTEQEDRNGNRITYTYDSSGSWTQAQHVRRGGQVMATVTVATTAQSLPAPRPPEGGRLDQLSVTAGGQTRTWSYGYDTSGNLTSSTDPDGKVTEYVYDTDHRLRCVKTPEGRRTRFAYETAPGRRVTSVIRVESGNCTTGTGPTTTFDYGAMQPEACAEDPDNLASVATAVTDANGNTTSYCYDGQDRVHVVIDAEGNRRETDYTAHGNVADLTDGVGSIAELTWSPDGGNLQEITSPASAPGQIGAVTSFSYTTDDLTVAGGDFLPSSAVDAEGDCTSYGYDASGNLTDVDSGRARDSTTGECDAATPGDQTDATYNADGTLSTIEAPNGDVTSYSYTGGNLTGVDPPGNVLGTESFTYDGNNRVATQTDGRGSKTCTAYDGNDRIVRLDFGVTGACPSPTSTCQSSCIDYDYDGDGNLVARTDGTGTTSFDYDLLGRLVAKRFGTPLAVCGVNAMTFVYDDVGNLVEYCDGGGTVTYHYNRLNLPAALSEPGGDCTANPPTLCTTFGYDGGDRRTTTNYPTTAPTVMAADYDGAGNVVRIAGRVNLLPNSQFETGTSGWTAVGGSATIARTDPADRRGHAGLASARLTATSTGPMTVTTTTGTGGVPVTANARYRYGAWVRGAHDDPTTALVRVRWYNSSGAPIGSSTTASGNAVDRRWERVTASDVSPTGAAFAAVEVRIESSATGEVYLLDDADLASEANADLLSDHAYTYNDGTQDRRLRRTMTDHVADETVNYGYDVRSRLESAVVTGGNQWHFDYDANGNRTASTLNSTTTWAQYASGDILCWTIVAGTRPTAACPPQDPLPTGATKYTHDGNGNLASSTAGHAFSYNHRNQTTAITTPTGSLGSLAYTDVGQSERTTAGGTTYRDSPMGVASATTSATDTTYWTRDSSGTLVSQRTVTATGTTRHYYVYDALGSTTALVTASGALAGGFRYRYDPYGNLLSGGTPPANPWRFANGHHDAATGLTKFGARYYDPALARWTQQDAIRGSVGTPDSRNLYSYVGGDPVNRTDVTGHEWDWWCGLLGCDVSEECLEGAATGFAAGLAAALVVPDPTDIVTWPSFTLFGCGVGVFDYYTDG